MTQTKIPPRFEWLDHQSPVPDPVAGGRTELELLAILGPMYPPIANLLRVAAAGEEFVAMLDALTPLVMSDAKLYLAWTRRQGAALDELRAAAAASRAARPREADGSAVVWAEEFGTGRERENGKAVG